ncbi:unnamed protein product [Blepharisma stoltei]|uniref:Spastin/Vps4 C-terminal domain-containing protein n=1 Tax=Blepharisma stoltei TaxID=1481888 RepID=A0AAU9JU82_9CILI|nr:unnamed protein product [Blepharisma stoltei]
MRVTLMETVRNPKEQPIFAFYANWSALKPSEVDANDFFRILDTIRSSVTPQDLIKQQQFTEMYWQEGQ